MFYELVDRIRIGDEVEIVFLEEDKSLLTRTVLVEGVSTSDSSGKKTRHLWANLDEKKYVIQDEEGNVNPKLIRITFLSHSPVSETKKFPVPRPPVNKPTIVKAKFPVPQDPRTIGK